MLKTILPILLCLSNAIYSQTLFHANYDITSPLAIYGDGYAIIRAAADSGFYTEASLKTAQDSGATLSFISPNGDVKWTKIYKKVPANFETKGFFANQIILPDTTLSINTYVDGSTVSLKVDMSGNLISAKAFSGSLIVTIYKEYLIGNFLYGVGRVPYGGINGGLFCKRDINGNLLWAKYLSDGTLSRIELRDFDVSYDGNFVFTGTRVVYNAGLPTASLIVKADSTGNIIWEKQLAMPGLSATPYRIIETQDHGFLMVVSNSFNGASVLVKTDSLGNTQWNYGFETLQNFNLSFYDLSEVGNDRYLVSGYVLSTNPNQLYSLTIDGAGNVVDVKDHPINDNVSILAQNYHPQKGLVTFGYRSAFIAYGYVINNMDTLFNSACSSSSLPINTYSNIITDSTLALPFVNIPITSVDVTSNVIVSNYVLTKTEYCPPVNVGVSNTNPNNVISWGPVPATDYVDFLSDGNCAEQNTILVYDVSGRMVYSNFFSGNRFKFERKGFKSGIYTFKIYSVNAFSSGKIVFY